uniref:CHM Rab escort protein n=1 Tax=Seriola lalandi dorsalis TaxID=1841481 RepID=A0A3B4X6G6_SERLL
MAAEDLPSEFDVVILGTGLAESVVAAACSRVGQRVLHLDRKSYYAANWASFTFNGLLTWIQQHHVSTTLCSDWLMSSSPCSCRKTTNMEDLLLLTGRRMCCGVKCFVQSQASHLEGEEPKADKPCPSTISYAQLVKEGRRFNIDLVSKLMYSRGSLVDLLIKSNVSRYAEFKNVTRILTYRHGNVEQVCTNCLFTCLSLCVRCPSVKLMCYLSVSQVPLSRYCIYLFLPQLGDNLQHFLLHSIAMVTEDTPTEVGLTSTRHFLRCLGRYGNTPFLFPVYGLGEIPQCFCRMCAVFGGIYCLRHSVHCLLVDKDTNRYQYYSLQYSQYYSLHYSEYSSLQYSENYSLQYSENYSLQYSQYYSLQYSQYYSLQYSENYSLQYSENYSLQYSENYSLQYSQYYSLHYSEYSSLQYSENNSLQYLENYSLQYSQYYSLQYSQYYLLQYSQYYSLQYSQYYSLQYSQYYLLQYSAIY